MALLRADDLPALLGLAGYSLTFHREAVGMADIRKAGSLAAGAAACHAEMIVADLSYARVYAHGHNLKSLIVMRDFGSGNPIARRVGLAVETRLVGPVNEAATVSPEFVEDLERAYTANVRAFAMKAAVIR